MHVWSSEERIGSHYYTESTASHRREYNERRSRIKLFNNNNQWSQLRFKKIHQGTIYRMDLGMVGNEGGRVAKNSITLHQPSARQAWTSIRENWCFFSSHHILSPMAFSFHLLMSTVAPRSIFQSWYFYLLAKHHILGVPQVPQSKRFSQIQLICSIFLTAIFILLLPLKVPIRKYEVELSLSLFPRVPFCFP